MSKITLLAQIENDQMLFNV